MGCIEAKSKKNLSTAVVPELPTKRELSKLLSIDSNIRTEHPCSHCNILV